jgi:hypothetical protein
MLQSNKLTAFKFVDGLTFYGFIQESNKDGWLVNVVKCDGLGGEFTTMHDMFIERSAVESHFTILAGGKSVQENGPDR